MKRFFVRFAGTLFICFCLTASIPLLKAQSGNAGPVYVLDRVVVDPDKRTGVPSGGPQTWRLEEASASATFGNPPLGHYTVSVGGKPPRYLRPGVSFEMTVSISGQAPEKWDYSNTAGLAASGVVIEPNPKNPETQGRALVLVGRRNNVDYNITSASVHY
jgi:hypothetical protein